MLPNYRWVNKVYNFFKFYLFTKLLEPSLIVQKCDRSHSFLRVAGSHENPKSCEMTFLHWTEYYFNSFFPSYSNNRGKAHKVDLLFYCQTHFTGLLNLLWCRNMCINACYMHYSSVPSQWHPKAWTQFTWGTLLLHTTICSNAPLFIVEC